MSIVIEWFESFGRGAIKRSRKNQCKWFLLNLVLVEMTRKRTRESLEHVLCDECPTCQGRGRVKTVETVCYEIMREIIRVNHLFSSEQFVVYASPAVADYLIKEESHGLLPEIEMFISKQVQVKTEQYYNQEQFDVVVM